MQDRKIPVVSQSRYDGLIEPEKTLVVYIREKPKSSFLGTVLAASLSSLAVTVSFAPPVQAKIPTKNIRKGSIVTLPSLDDNAVESNQRAFHTNTSSLEEPASKFQIQANVRQTATIKEIPQLPTLEDIPLEYTKALKKIHTVEPGDTIVDIARQYGVSSRQIVEANKISNPNRIKIDSQLVIPKTEATSASDRSIANLQHTPRFSSGNNFIIADALKPASLSSIAEKKAETQANKTTNNSATDSSSEMVEPTSKTTATQNVNSDSLVGKLRQNIVELRTKYQNQSGDNPQEVVTNTPTIEPTPKPAPQAETASEIIIPVPAPASGDISENSVPAERSVATATPSGENLNTVVNVSGTRATAPNLPPLSSPEEYLPENPVFDGYMWPAKGTLTSGYGWRWGRMHKGIDIAAPVGTPIMAAASGEVIFAGWNSGGYGNLVKLKHQDGSITFYAHNNRVLVSSGQKVRQGELIAEMGSTGRSTGPHLHFEIRPNGSTAIDPIARLPRDR